MSGILETLAQHISPEMVTQLSTQMGIDPATAQKAISTALPGVFGAMAEHANSDSGAAEIHQAVQQTAAPTVPAATPPADAGLLDKLMGHRTDAVQQNIAQSSGLDMQQAGKMLMYLAPIAVAVLSRQHSQQPDAAQQPGGLSGILRGVQQATQGANVDGANLGGGIAGVLGRMLG